MKPQSQAAAFAALGDATRLSIVLKLCTGRRLSISQLTEGSELTRQAVTKHLRVLEGVRMVHGLRVGREVLFEFNSEPLGEMKSYLDRVSRQWDQTLARLKSFVEDQ